MLVTTLVVMIAHLPARKSLTLPADATAWSCIRPPADRPQPLVSPPPRPLPFCSGIGEVYGVPKVHYKGQQGEFYVVIMDLLGPRCGAIAFGDGFCGLMATAGAGAER